MPDRHESILALHRYFIWANEMRLRFDSELANVQTGTSAWGSERFIHIHMFMCFWCGLLSTVIEGWRDLRLDDPGIMSLLQVPTGRTRTVTPTCKYLRFQFTFWKGKAVPETYADLLRQVRNTVFHYQRDYFDNRLIEFMRRSETVAWVRQLYAAFDAWFLNWLRVREGTPS